MSSARDDIDRTVVQLLLAEPFFGHCLLGVRKEVVQDGTLAAITIDGSAACLRVDEARWASASVAQRRGALKHELLHLVLRHPQRRPEFGNAALFNLCADLVVNQYLTPEQLEDGAPTIALFPFLERDRSVDTYYRALRDVDDELVRRAMDEASEAQRRHEPWATLATLDDLERSVLELALIEHLRETAKATPWGHLSGDLRRLLEQHTRARPAIDWRRTLRLFAANAAETKLQSTVHRASRRYGTTPGIKIRTKHEVYVVIDTSGSIGARDLAVFSSEIAHIHRAGASVTVIECDAEVKRVYPFRGRFIGEVIGGGGTNVDPALAHCNSARPDAIVFLTDGHFPPPKIAPRSPVLWMITQRGAPLQSLSALPGRMAKLGA